MNTGHIHQRAIVSRPPLTRSANCTAHWGGGAVRSSVTSSMGSNSISNKGPVDVCHAAGLNRIIIRELAVVWLNLEGQTDDRRAAKGNGSGGSVDKRPSSWTQLALRLQRAKWRGDWTGQGAAWWPLTIDSLRITERWLWGGCLGTLRGLIHFDGSSGSVWDTVVRHNVLLTCHVKGNALPKYKCHLWWLELSHYCSFQNITINIVCFRSLKDCCTLYIVKYSGFPNKSKV